jgi:hypothetical protein
MLAGHGLGHVQHVRAEDELCGQMVLSDETGTSDDLVARIAAR